MRYFFTLLVIAFSIPSGIAQEKMGAIGKFKIHVTTIAIISELEAELGEKAFINAEREKPEYKITELVVDQAARYTYTQSPYTSFCKQSRVFYMPEYTIANINVKKVYLTFYRDTLVKLECDVDSKLEDALIAKFGKGKRTFKAEYRLCSTAKDEMFETTWLSDNIEGILLSKKFHTEPCNAYHFSTFVMNYQKNLEAREACAEFGEAAYKDLTRPKKPDGF